MSTERAKTKVRVVSPIAALAHGVAAKLEREGWTLSRIEAGAAGHLISHGAGIDAQTLVHLRQAVFPFYPRFHLDAALHDEIVVALSPPLELPLVIDHLVGESEMIVAAVERDLMAVGGTVRKREVAPCGADLLRHGEMDSVDTNLVEWVLAQNGIVVQEEEDDTLGGGESRIFVLDPARAQMDPRARFPVEILTDDPEAGRSAAERLLHAGFTLVTWDAVPEPGVGVGYRLEPGPYRSAGGDHGEVALRAAVEDWLREVEIDHRGYPLEVVPTAEVDATQGSARVWLPFGAYRGGKLRPTGEDHLGRYDVSIFTDDPTAIYDLVHDLRVAGSWEPKARPIDVAEVPSKAFRVLWGAADRSDAVSTTILRLVSTHLAARPGGDRFEVVATNELADDDHDIDIYFPVVGLADGSLYRRLHHPGGYDLTLFVTGETSAWRWLFDELNGWGFAKCKIIRKSVSPGVIKYGGARLALLERIVGYIDRRAGIRCELDHAWGFADNDIWVYLPEEAARRPEGVDVKERDNAATTTDAAPTLAVELSTWVAGDPSPAAATTPSSPFVEMMEGRVRIGAVVLARRSGGADPLAPDPASFAGYCLDSRTADTLEHVATCVALGEPCLLEGETSTSKTSSILYLAALLGQPVVRLNLNGQTDTGELIGRFVPEHLASELPVSREELDAAEDYLETETRLILERAQRQKRPLSQVEVQQIIANEGLTTHPWRWQEGLVPLAMRRGWWLLLDEMNLAEPQILERLNSVLEPSPTLVVTENDNAVIGGPEVPLHPGFRIFGTMNPAEYAGRSVLSPAYRDRWRGYRFVPRPGEREYGEMLRFVVYGTQPEVVVRGRRYAGATAPSRYPQLATLPATGDLLQALARFHAGLEAAVGQTEGGVARIGARRKERYVFTRRTLLSLLDYLASPLADLDPADPYRSVRAALVRYYLDRIVSGEERQMVVQLLDAAGIGPGTWSIAAAANPDTTPADAATSPGSDDTAAGTS